MSILLVSGFEHGKEDERHGRNGSLKTRVEPPKLHHQGSAKSDIDHHGIDFDEDDEDVDPGFISRIVKSIHTVFQHVILENKKTVKIIGLLILVGLYVAYMAVAINYNINYHVNVDFWCDGFGMFLIITGLLVWGLIYYFILKRYLGKPIRRKVFKPISRTLSPWLKLWYVQLIIAVLILAGVGVFLYFDTAGQPARLISAGGFVVLILLGLFMSKHPGRVQWGQVLWGIGIQFIMGLLVLRWEGGKDAFDCISGKVSTFLGFTSVGANFVYGHLASGYNYTLTSDSEIRLDPVFVFANLSVIFFFSFFIQLLYFYGIMQWVVEKLGWVLQITVGTTAAESMNAAANIFVGQTEAPILIKPFLPKMTNSELHAVMTGGFATIAGSVMAAYISMGIEPTYLLSASVMAAPAALAYSKLMYPETKKSQTTAKHIKFMEAIKPEGNALDAAAQGAMQGVLLIGNIVANLVAFMAFVAFLDAIFIWLGVMIGVEELSFQWLLSQIFIPVAYLIGIDPEETEQVAKLLGLKTVVNEFVAYQELSSMTGLSDRSRAIATYALCSFANISSVGIQLGGLSVMAPERRTDLSKTIFRSLVAGSIVGLLNACIAGTLLSAEGYKPPV